MKQDRLRVMKGEIYQKIFQYGASFSQPQGLLKKTEKLQQVQNHLLPFPTMAVRSSGIFSTFLFLLYFLLWVIYFISSKKNSVISVPLTINILGQADTNPKKKQPFAQPGISKTQKICRNTGAAKSLIYSNFCKN